MWLQAGAGNGVKCSTRGSLASTKVLQREEREEEFCLASRCRCLLILVRMQLHSVCQDYISLCSKPKLFPRCASSVLDS